MSLKELAYAQALTLAGELEENQQELLKVLCAAAVTALEGQLRDGLTAEDCKADFLAAASLYALSGLSQTGDGVQEFRTGELTVKRESGDAASRCLKRQAELIIRPYLKDRFAFLGV